MARRQSTFSVELRAQSFFNICRGHALLFQVTLATTFAVVSQTGTRRNQSTNHNVFFQTSQEVTLTGHRTFGEHPGGFLERSRRNERFGGQRCLGNTKQQTLEPGWLFVRLIRLFVLFQHLSDFHLVARQQGGITRIGNFHLAQHLPNDNLDVFIVDDNALQAVHVLDFVGDVLGQLDHTQQTQDVVRVGRTVGNHLTLLNRFTFENVELAMLRNQNLIGIVIFRRDDQALLAFGLFTERHHTTDFRQDGGLFRATSLEQVGNPWQTTGDVPGLRAFLGNTGNHVTQLDLRAIGHGHQRVSRQEEDRGTTTRQLYFFACIVNQLDGRTNVLTSCGTLFRVNHFHGGQTSQLISLGADSNALFHVDELGRTFRFGDDRVRVRIPLGNHNTGLNHVTVLHRQNSTVGQLVPLALTALLVGNRQRR